jgi:chromosome segregation protein
VVRAVSEVLGATERALADAAVARDAISAASLARDGELADLRTRIGELVTEVDSLRDAAHRDEVRLAETRLRLEALCARAEQDYGVDPQTLLAEYGPTVPIPMAESGQGADGENGVLDYVRTDQEQRASAAERQLALLGKVNPLALEEYTALEERHAFLSAQVEDLKASRRDILGIVREVDEHIQEVFRAAFEDTAREFGAVFATLFPGGEGRLTLTDPDDLATTGVEVHARPEGKRLTRLSLLSGGERSLAAIALLVAIFRARPSPFYVLDEVEAALDDRNLGRLLECLQELRATSQLIVITHQKRTMEVADALYGVSMRGDGVSSVISQRLRETETATA